jgi:hypothetical protein
MNCLASSDTTFAASETLPIFFDGPHRLRIHQLLGEWTCLGEQCRTDNLADSRPFTPPKRMLRFPRRAFNSRGRTKEQTGAAQLRCLGDPLLSPVN